MNLANESKIRIRQEMGESRNWREEKAAMEKKMASDAAKAEARIRHLEGDLSDAKADSETADVKRKEAETAAAALLAEKEAQLAHVAQLKTQLEEKDRLINHYLQRISFERGQADLRADATRCYGFLTMYEQAQKGEHLQWTAKQYEDAKMFYEQFEKGELWVTFNPVSDSEGNVIWTPPSDPEEVSSMRTDVERTPSRNVPSTPVTEAVTAEITQDHIFECLVVDTAPPSDANPTPLQVLSPTNRVNVD